MRMMNHIYQVIPSMLHFNNKPSKNKMRKKRMMKRKKVVFKNFHSSNISNPIKISMKPIAKRLSPPFKLLEETLHVLSFVTSIAKLKR